MAIIQISKIQVRTGSNNDLPQLSPGEFGYATDQNRLYIGNDPVIGVNPTPDNTEILTEFSDIPAAGNNGQIQFNNAGTTAGNVNMTYNAGVLTVTNETITGNVVLPGNIMINSSVTTSDIGGLSPTYKLGPIMINGTEFYICLTTTP